MVYQQILRLSADSNTGLIHQLLSFICKLNEIERFSFKEKIYFGIKEIEKGSLSFIDSSFLIKKYNSQTKCDIFYENGIGDIVSIELISENKLSVIWTCWDQDGEIRILSDGKKEIVSFRDHEQWRKNKLLTKKLAKEDLIVLIQELSKKTAA